MDYFSAEKSSCSVRRSRGIHFRWFGQGQGMSC